MKKQLAVLLALFLIVTLGTTVFANTPAPETIYYISYPTVPSFANLQHVSYSSQVSSGSKMEIFYDYDSTQITVDLLLRRYSELLSAEGFSYVSAESSALTSITEIDGVRTESTVYRKIVFHDTANDVKIVAELTARSTTHYNSVTGLNEVRLSNFVTVTMGPINPPKDEVSIDWSTFLGGRW